MAPTLTLLGVAVTGGASGVSNRCADPCDRRGREARPAGSIPDPTGRLIAVGTWTTAWSHPITPAATFVLDRSRIRS